MNNHDNHAKKLSLPVFRLALVIFALFLFRSSAMSQDEKHPKFMFKGGSYDETFSTSRIGLSQSVLTTPQGEFHLVIQHRFAEIETGAYNLFGLDGAIARIGFDYGITDWLSAGIGRSLFEKTYDLEFKAVILKQDATNVPVSVSYYISFMDNTSRNYFPAGHDSFGPRLSIANQIFIARNQGIFSLQLSPVWLHNDYEIRTGNKLDVFALDIDARARLTDKLGIFAEYIDIFTKTPFPNTSPLTFGLDINTGGHQFQLILSNSQGLNEKSYLTNTTGSWSKGHIYFGFNLTRVFHAKAD